MTTYTQLIYQIVFSTKNKERSLTKLKRQELYNYITGVIKNKNCHLYRINGIEDHIHIITHIHPTIAISTFVKDIKMSSTDFIKREKLFQNFNGWQNGYGAFTYSLKDKDRLIEYVKNQEVHHHIKTFNEEYIDLLNEHGIEFDEKYLL
ncbi:MAG: IS200/IS605 family transposase [bacterium]|nr:IS200/IS605 family transposase [bacterium]